MTRGRRAAAAAAVAGLALAVRALPWREVLGGSSVAVFGNDAWYHLRRIAWSVRNFPDVLDFDPYLAFPVGGAPIWSPALDWGAAALARLAGLGADDLERIERAAVWAPPLFGAAAVLVAMHAARRLEPGAAWVCGLVLALLPAHFHTSQIGFVDHHAAATWLAAASAAALMALHAAEDAGEPGPAWTCAALAGLAIAAAFAVWPGALVSLVFLELGAALALWRAATGGDAARRVLRLAAAHAVAALCIAPLAWGQRWPQWSAESPLVLSRFQPALLAGLALGAGGCALLWGRTRWGASPLRRAISSCGLALALASGALALWPGLGEGLLEAQRWLLRRDAFQVLVDESRPLLLEDGQLAPRIALERFGAALGLYPLALAWFAVSALRRPERWIPLCFAAGLFAVTLLQRRFMDTAAVGYVWVMAAALCALWRGAAARRRPVLAVAAALWLLPAPLAYTRHLANEWRARAGEPLVAGTRFGAARAGLELAAWLRAHTPPTRGWLEPGAQPEYGVLAPWPLGHLIVHRGRRPAALGNFGDDLGAEPYLAAQRIFAAGETEALRALDARRLRYVVAEAASQQGPGPAPRGSFLHRLYFTDGTGLAQLRLVFETRGVVLDDPAAPPRYKVFERVAGARISGRAAPGAVVEASLGLRTQRGRALRYRARARADEEGRYRLTLPYATGPAPGGVAADPTWLLRCGADRAQLALGEEAVREGREVRGPALCPTLTGASPATDTGGP